MDGRNEGRRRVGVRRLHRELPAEIREGGRLPEARIETRCSLSTTSRPSTGDTCGRPPPSKAPSPPCATVPCDRRAVCQTAPRSRWSSTGRGRTEKLAPSTVTTSCQNSSRCDIRRRDRGHRQADRPSTHNRRRLTGPAVTKIWR
jgi:hypothetical protein